MFGKTGLPIQVETLAAVHIIAVLGMAILYAGVIATAYWGANVRYYRELTNDERKNMPSGHKYTHVVYPLWKFYGSDTNGGAANNRYIRVNYLSLIHI